MAEYTGATTLVAQERSEDGTTVTGETLLGRGRLGSVTIATTGALTLPTGTTGALE